MLWPMRVPELSLEAKVKFEAEYIVSAVEMELTFICHGDLVRRR